jgi:heme oxygenase
MRLNVATRQWHADVDEPWLHLLRTAVSRTDYCTQLVRTFGFVAPFESACRYTPGLEAVLTGRELGRAGLIAQDLLALGLSPSQVATVPQCHGITTFKDVPEALAWVYVVERTTLLQEGIRRHLLANVPELDVAVSYLAAFDGRGGDHWRTFGRLLDRIGSTAEVCNEIIAAAKMGFSCAKDWFGNSFEQRRTG